jgi:hypothetical protein
VVEAGPHLPVLELQGPREWVASQAKAGRQAQLCRRARALLPCTLLASYDARSASKQAWASCRARTPWASAMWPGRSVDLLQLELPELSYLAV